MPTQHSTAAITIRPATPGDCELLLTLIYELAEFEQLADQVSATTQTLRDSLFGCDATASALIAETAREVIGYAVFFPTFSTFTGQSGLYLEDVYLRPRWRGIGAGKKLFQQVARIAVERGCPRLEWAVLRWNRPAVEFYDRLGAETLSEWQGLRLSGPALRTAAGLDHEV